MLCFFWLIPGLSVNTIYCITKTLYWLNKLLNEPYLTIAANCLSVSGFNYYYSHYHLCISLSTKCMSQYIISKILPSFCYVNWHWSSCCNKPRNHTADKVAEDVIFEVTWEKNQHNQRHVIFIISIKLRSLLLQAVAQCRLVCLVTIQPTLSNNTEGQRSQRHCHKSLKSPIISIHSILMLSDQLIYMSFMHLWHDYIT
jgi:hypothetical protein